MFSHFIGLVLSILVILWSLRKQHVRRSFNIILHRPIAVSAGIILLFFIAIGVLDSIHWMPTNNKAETSSTVLDTILAPIDQITEKTYSSPLALRQFISETSLIDGVVQQSYPRLVYAAKIKTEQDKKRVIRTAFIYALQCSMVLLFLLGFLVVAVRFFLGLKLFTITPSSISVLITLGMLGLFVVFGYELSRTFHVLGTDKIGQDILYLTIKSIRTGLVIGFLTTLFMLPLALFLGIVAGYFGGWADDVIQYLYTTLSSIPGVLLITASVLSLQIYIANHPGQFVTLAQSADARLFALCFILGVTSWTNLCRLLRAETLKLREVDFVLAARALGSNWFTIIRKHLLPNVMHLVVITLVLDFSFLVMAEALLSYVGAGVSPMTISWGNMINSARLELARDPVIWWPMFAAFMFMFLLVLAINLFADALRDAFDPHQSHI